MHSDFLKNDILILDGAMGTVLQQRGLPPGGQPELLNLTEPELLEYEKGEPYWGMHSNVPYEYRHCYVKDGQGQTDIVTALEYMQRKAEIEKDLVPVELDWRPLEEYGKK